MGDIKLPEPYSVVTEGWGSHGQCTRDVAVYTAEQAEAYAEARAKQAAELERERCERACFLIEVRYTGALFSAANDNQRLKSVDKAEAARECFDAIRGTK